MTNHLVQSYNLLSRVVIVIVLVLGGVIGILYVGASTLDIGAGIPAFTWQFLLAGLVMTVASVAGIIGAARDHWRLRWPLCSLGLMAIGWLLVWSTAW